MQPNNTITGVEIFSDWDDTCDYKKNSLPNQEQIIDVEKNYCLIGSYQNSDKFFVDFTRFWTQSLLYWLQLIRQNKFCLNNDCVYLPTTPPLKVPQWARSWIKQKNWITLFFSMS